MDTAVPRMRFSERSAAGIWTLALGLAFVSGCDSGDASHGVRLRRFLPSRRRRIPRRPRTPHPATADQKALRTGPFEKTLDGIRLSIPAGWKEVELSGAQQGFIDARFQIPTAHGDVTLTCSSNGGGIETNVRRWAGQFHAPAGKQPVIGDLDVGGKKATWVDLQGEFDAGPMAAANAGSAPPVDRMLGVAIPLGSRDFYLKLTGNDAAVSDIRDAFRQFARDARPLN